MTDLFLHGEKSFPLEISPTPQVREFRQEVERLLAMAEAAGPFGERHLHLPLDGGRVMHIGGKEGERDIFTVDIIDPAKKAIVYADYRWSDLQRRDEVRSMFVVYQERNDLANNPPERPDVNFAGFPYSLAEHSLILEATKQISVFNRPEMFKKLTARVLDYFGAVPLEDEEEIARSCDGRLDDILVEAVCLDGNHEGARQTEMLTFYTDVSSINQTERVVAKRRYFLDRGKLTKLEQTEYQELQDGKWKKPRMRATPLDPEQSWEVFEIQHLTMTGYNTTDDLFLAKIWKLAGERNA